MIFFPYREFARVSALNRFLDLPSPSIFVALDVLTFV